MLNQDVLYLIFFEELQDDRKTLYSCLSVNKTWCEIIVPIIWKDPWKFLKEENEKLLLTIIISHLSDESRNNLSQGVDFLTHQYKKPLFDYISFCRHLNFNEIGRIIDTYILLEERRVSIKNDIINIFINENTRFTHLYIPHRFDNQIHLIPGAEQCFSDLQFLCCKTGTNEKVLVGLTKICKSIKELELSIGVFNNNYGIVKLIENQKRLYNIRFMTRDQYTDETFCINLENSLIKHANTIEYFKITRPLNTNILSSFINLKRLELVGKFKFRNITWNCLNNLFLPYLQSLKASFVPIDDLTNLIENTSGNLIEIKIDRTSHNEINNKRIIQIIYQNCPKLKYLKLLIRNTSSLELEKLLINCKCLNGLYFIISDLVDTFNWDNLFEMLTKLSPTSLFKFKFSYYYKQIDSESLKLFFNNWKGRHPMLLQMISRRNATNIEKYFDLIEKFKAEGIIKKYDYNTWYENAFEDFEWI
ncbi:hypothetical protein C1645_820926 [Glomus cerebriforme]|uniref:F-box domain-containing protein n=1 Tax=Glomus cerebriforme TaxID=658196 RepID=A0A397TB65_9GLOM|nr:hypothetical protein C1645_820926 [Glomus cerebriforme]